jgi:hypothetical protein
MTTRDDPADLPDDYMVFPPGTSRPVRVLVYALGSVAVLSLVAPVLVLAHGMAMAYVDQSWAADGSSSALWLGRSVWLMPGYPIAFVLAGAVIAISQMIRRKGLRRALRDGGSAALTLMFFPLYVAWAILTG